ncbi:MAG: hypothetical protein E6K96_09720 [Thaumarchaeota archaeon]|nr:MAG: hypothetical protein E6K96_09720 [Nitrososphaerota archaeon]
MVAPIVITILAYLHIISAMGWLGGAALFVSVVGPGLRSLSLTARLEFLSKIGPGATRFFIGSSTATIVFGLALLFSFPGASSATLTTGLAVGLIAYLDAILVAIPSLRKADHLAKEMLASGQAGGPPSPELAKALKRGGIGVATVVVLLVITLISMVTAGFPF